MRAAAATAACVVAWAWRTDMNKQQCMDQGESAGKLGERPRANPYKEGSWQFKAWGTGWEKGYAAYEVPIQKAANAAEAGRGMSAKDMEDVEGILSDFPVNMPAATREHIRRLDADAMKTSDSTRALRLDRKIAKLFERHA